jgi:uncharacterized protein
MRRVYAKPTGTKRANGSSQPMLNQEKPVHSTRTWLTTLALWAVVAAAPGCAATSAALVPASASAFSQNRPHKVVLQVSDAEPAKWNLALNNARNVQEDLGRDQVSIEIVAYGPGIGMLKLDSVAGARVAEALGAGVSVVACENTMRNQKIKREDMLPGIGYVAAGVVQLMVRQQQGYAYIRP